MDEGGWHASKRGDVQQLDENAEETDEKMKSASLLPDKLKVKLKAGKGVGTFSSFREDEVGGRDPGRCDVQCA